MAFDDCDIEIKPRLGQDNRYRLYDAQLVLNPRQKNNHSIKLAEPRSPERQSYQQFKDTVEDFLAPIGQGYSPSSF